MLESSKTRRGYRGARRTVWQVLSLDRGLEAQDNDAFTRVYNNLLLHEYIYYFTPVHFQLAVCPFFYINLPILVARQQCIRS